jgi:sigma-B regulation protein RsbU (phosphoserine phosphatase)
VILPSETPIEHPFVRVAGAFRSMAECGGDFWAAYELAEGRTLVLVGDVTGHGLPAAIVTGAARAASATAVSLTKGKLGAGEILAAMNGAIHETAKRQVMMTCTAAVLDPVASTVTLANAGHHFSYLVRAGLARPLVAHGPPLGAAPDAQYDEVTAVLQPGDTLVWFTDGLIESENEWGEQFTEKRLRALCQRVASEGAVAARDGILEMLTLFRGKHPLSDDVTVVVATIK